MQCAWRARLRQEALQVLHGGEGDGDDECDPEAQAAPLQQRARAQPPRPQHCHKPDRQPPADGVAQAEAYRALEGGPHEPDVLVQRHFPVNEEAKRLSLLKKRSAEAAAPPSRGHTGGS